MNKSQDYQTHTSTPRTTQAQSPGHPEASPTRNDQQIPINGFQQVVEMLRIADPAFRESLLRRLGQRDPQLAHTLRLEL